MPGVNGSDHLVEKIAVIAEKNNSESDISEIEASEASGSPGELSSSQGESDSNDYNNSDADGSDSKMSDFNDVKRKDSKIIFLINRGKNGPLEVNDSFNMRHDSLLI